ncbi:PAS domain-containing protein [Photorhabdus temperata subsp. temperata]|uniref:Response regulator containing a CheY-like receiver domain and an HTH DNA-binding protein n=2 Tax=Photorhabdus temperata TaxID=574560 RepID=A0A081RY57_PHOTE|nr:PAS and helix-turn-helix domain-containing protein [Photorhabdus temperata]ERT12618.1 LuxR family transcriptional regulator [Photorhabdus temperata J3]KER03610.1 response regulator containing a CheY-like receiver domain and an HTH DNA-binding protein [Photorhabdus temperata subsp. temperata Meg1]
MSQITPQLTNMWDRSHESWFVKDKKLRLIYANNAFIKLNKLPEHVNVTGYTAKELPIPFNHLVHLFEEHDRKVLQTMQRISSIGAHLQSNSQQLKPYFCEKYPLMNENNQCIGIIGHIKEINHFSVHHYIKNDTIISVKLRPPNNILTEKEWTIIFLFCRGISSQCIANEMKISCRTVEKYFESIYEKLSIRSIIELKLFCEENNYDLYIPPKYFKSMNHFLLD